MSAMKNPVKRICALALCLCLLLTLTGCSPESQYAKANKLLAEGKYAQAAEKFEALGSFEDAPMLTMYAKAAAAGEAGQFETCLQAFETLGDFKDSQMMVTYYTGRQYETNGNWKDHLAAAEIYDMLPLFRDCTQRAADCRKAAYDTGEAFAAEAKYNDAIQVHTALGDYSDSASLVAFYEACRLEQNGEYGAAAAMFELLGTLRSANDRAQAARQAGYETGTAKMADGHYDEAYAILLPLGDYAPERSEPAAAIAKECMFLQGEAMAQQNQYAYALLAYRAAGDHPQAVEMAAVLEAQLRPNAMIAVRGQHSVGLRADGTVVATGYNKSGQCNVGRWTDVVQVASGYDHTLGLKQDGTVVATGWNYYGQCEVSGWSDIIQITSGNSHTVGLKRDGTVVAAGNNDDGQNEVGSWTGITAVATGGLHTLGLKADGTLIAAGWNNKGQCEVGGWFDMKQVAGGYQHTVGLRQDGTVVAVGSNDNDQCEVAHWSGIVAVAAGSSHTIGLKYDGTVVAVGNNENGQCNVSGWSEIIAVAAGKSHTIGLKADGTVIATGDNARKQCNVTDWTGIGPNAEYVKKLLAE